MEAGVKNLGGRTLAPGITGEWDDHAGLGKGLFECGLGPKADRGSPSAVLLWECHACSPMEEGPRMPLSSLPLQW